MLSRAHVSVCSGAVSPGLRQHVTPSPCTLSDGWPVSAPPFHGVVVTRGKGSEQGGHAVSPKFKYDAIIIVDDFSNKTINFKNIIF